jgi:hypothetical protein
MVVQFRMISTRNKAEGPQFQSDNGDDSGGDQMVYLYLVYERTVFSGGLNLMDSMPNKNILWVWFRLLVELGKHCRAATANSRANTRNHKYC